MCFVTPENGMARAGFRTRKFKQRPLDRVRMVPGFVQLGALAVLAQLVVIGGFYGYLRLRHTVPSVTRRRIAVTLVGGSALAALGQLAALGAIGSLQVSPALSFEQAMLVQDAGLALALLGYTGVFAGFGWYWTAGS